MRVTIHLVSPRDYWPLAVAVRDARRALWLRAWKEPGAEEMAAAARTLAEHARRRRPPAQGGRGADRQAGRARHPPVAGHRARAAVRDLGAPARGPLRRRRGLAPRERSPATGEAMDHLVRRYLEAFGPASRKDVQSFTGLNLTTLKPVLERVATERFLDEDGGELVDVAGAPLPPARTRPRPSGCCRRGTRRCSCTPAAPACCPSASAR